MNAPAVQAAPAGKSLEFQHSNTRTPQQARRWLSEQLEAAHVPAATIEDCESVAAELVANAGQHVGGRILFSEQVTELGVELTVFDGGHVPPERWNGPGGLYDERGRGSAIVEALAVEVTVTMHPSGKSVRALIGYRGAEADQ